MSNEMKNDYQAISNPEGVQDVMREQAEGVNKVFQDFMENTESAEAKEDTEKKEEQKAAVEMRLNKGGDVSFAGGCSRKCVRCNVDSSDCSYN